MEDCIFVKACYPILNITTGQASYANASHPFPLLLHSDGLGFKHLGKSSRHNNFSLGLMEDSTYELFAETLPPGGTLLFYTDSLCDMCDSDGKIFQKKDLMEVLRGFPSFKIENLLKTMIVSMLERSNRTVC